MTLDQAVSVRTQQLCGKWVAPADLADAIETIRRQVIDVSRSQYRKATRKSQRVVRVI